MFYVRLNVGFILEDILVLWQLSYNGNDLEF